MPLVSTLRFIAGHPLSRGARLQAIGRFARWQIASRLAPGAIVQPWVGGSKFLVRAGETGMTGNVYTGLHDFADMGYLLHVLRDTDLFVDVGANAGSYTILASAAIGARSIAFEPAPETYRRLVDNVRINHREGRVECLNVAVGREAGTVRFSGGSDTTNHIAVVDEPGADVIEVPLRTLDSVLTGEDPVVLKMDIEGYELPALEGAQQVLAGPALHSVIMELNGSGRRYGFEDSRVVELMSDHGFRTFAYDPLRRSLEDLNGRSHAQGNTIFIRNRESVSQRLAGAAPFSVFGKAI